MMIKIEKITKDILISSLGVSKEERGLVFCDDYDGDGKLKERLLIVDKFVTSSKDLVSDMEKMVISNSGGNGIEPNILLWEKIFGKDFIEKIKGRYGWDRLERKDISVSEISALIDKGDLKNIPDFVIALSYFSTSHTAFRKILNQLGTRYISMPLFDFEMFEGPLNIDFPDLEKETMEFWNNLQGKKGCIIRNDIGTELSFNFEGRELKADTGNFKKKGSFGNLPAGEVFVAPLETKTEGNLVIEWTNEGKLKEPLIAKIKNGKVVDLKGDERVKIFLNGIFERDERNNCLCELGFGTNRKAKRADNILEAEKIYGTAHVAFGDNITFGGNNRASTHIDYVIFNPKIEWY